MLKAQGRVWEICLSWLMIRRHSWNLRVIYCRLILPGELNINFDHFKPNYSFTTSYWLCSALSFFVLSKTRSQSTALMATEQWETRNYFGRVSPLAIAAWFVLSLAPQAAPLLPGSWLHTFSTRSAQPRRSWARVWYIFHHLLFVFLPVILGVKGV